MDRRKDTQGTREDGQDGEEMTQAQSQSASSGGAVARDVGSRDELENDEAVERVEKADKVQPETGTRSDHSGGQGQDKEPGLIWSS